MSQTQAIIFSVFSAIGLIDTLYLSYHVANKTNAACWFFPEEWCQKVQHSKYSKTFGVPNPYLGLIMYLAILSLVIYVLAGMVPSWLVEVVVIFGFAFSVYFTFVQAFLLKAFCTWCVVSAINFVVMFAAIFLK